MSSDIQQAIYEINRARRAGSAAPPDTPTEATFSPSRKLFVYGTLGPGQPNEWMMRRIGGRWREAVVRGQLRPAASGRFPYPLFSIDPEGKEVEGHLFISPDLPHYWEKLDRFEGPSYVRLLIPAYYRDGSRDVANIYAAADPGG